MTYMNSLCADVGTVNCPCPLAETGDCLVCSRLAGRKECDCRWAGVCIYNEYIQNGSTVRGRRGGKPAAILKKVWYGGDLVVITLNVSKGFALQAAQPGSFVFLNAIGKSDFYNVPVSVMKTEPDKGELSVALKVISGKTKIITDEENFLMLRGVYRNGLLGGGIQGLWEDIKQAKDMLNKKRWLIITKGVGFAPAVNLIKAAEGHIRADFVIDTEKINDEIVMDCLQRDMKDDADISFRKESLQSMINDSNTDFNIDDYDRVILLTSDYYIKTLSESMHIPHDKLVFCNNFRMCCGEGICGACGHIDENGNVNKMCKCRSVDLEKIRI